METTNRERVGKALELLQAGLGPFVDREMESKLEEPHVKHVVAEIRNHPQIGNRPVREWDVLGLLKLMYGTWHKVFCTFLGWPVYHYVSEMRDDRNRWAHQRHFSVDDTYRALDTAHRLLTAVAATHAADDVEKLKMEMRVRLAEQARGERDKKDSLLIENAVMSVNDTADLMLGKDTHAPGEVEDSVLHTLCGLKVYSHGPAVDGGRVAARDRPGDVDCLVCRDYLQE